MMINYETTEEDTTMFICKAELEKEFSSSKQP